PPRRIIARGRAAFGHNIEFPSARSLAQSRKERVIIVAVKRTFPREDAIGYLLVRQIIIANIGRILALQRLAARIQPLRQFAGTGAYGWDHGKRDDQERHTKNYLAWLHLRILRRRHGECPKRVSRVQFLQKLRTSVRCPNAAFGWRRRTTLAGVNFHVRMPPRHWGIRGE